ncbi:MAG TPA: branched-chain amino acid transaminase [Acidobacteriota bacterium]|nr:branched-chain amino acid transaminase [Acidobacteriota bacterium]
MSEIRADKVWHNGELIDWDDARIHVVSHSVHYGTAWFEGIRCYRTSRGSEVFRLPEHVRRLYDSCSIYRTRIPFTPEEFQAAILETIKANRLEACYIRPIILRGQGAIGVNPKLAEIQSFIMVWEWGKYLGEESQEKGVKVCTSSWNRAAPNTFPTIAKAAGNYLNSVLVKMEAEARGYQEGIALDTQGLISEGSGENLFLVRDDVIYTSELVHAILPGITRDCVLTLARELGFTVKEQALPREMLYLCDEVFFTGTACEITPISSIDDRPVGEGRRGPVTEALQKAFFEIVEGKVADRHRWLTPVG